MFKLLYFRHALIVFGGVQGLEASLETDENLDIDDPSLLFQHYLNTCPSQGSRTIRTEVQCTYRRIMKCLCLRTVVMYVIYYHTMLALFLYIYDFNELLPFFILVIALILFLILFLTWLFH